MKHDETCTGGFGLGVEDRPSCPGCRVDWQEFQDVFEEVDRRERFLNGLPLIGLLRRVTEEPLRQARNWRTDRMRKLKWKLTRLMEEVPMSRFCYPLFQLVISQQVWIVNGTWYIARDAKKAAEYFGMETFPDGDICVDVTYPFSATASRFMLTYCGSGEFEARPHD